MSKKRRNHSPAFKSKVALAAVKGDQTLSELSQQYGINSNLIVKWKKQLIEQSDEVFASGQGLAPAGRCPLCLAARAIDPVERSNPVAGRLGEDQGVGFLLWARGVRSRTNGLPPRVGKPHSSPWSFRAGLHFGRMQGHAVGLYAVGCRGIGLYRPGRLRAGGQ